VFLKETRVVADVHSSIRNKYDYIVHIVLVFLPVWPKFQRNSTSDDQAQRDIHQQVLCDIPKIVLEPVTQYVPNRGDINSGSLWHGSDGEMRHCWAILASWLADNTEHANLWGFKWFACPKCQTPKEEPGSLILPPVWNPARDNQQSSSRTIGSTRMPKLIVTVRL